MPTKKSVCIESVAFTGSPVTHCYRTKLGLGALWPIPNPDCCVIFGTDCSYIPPKSLALQERISSAIWRIQPEGFFNFANPLTADVIQIEHRHGCAANGSPSFHFIAFESKVLRPPLPDGMKQGHLLACRRINGRCPVGFMQIASGACYRSLHK